jgi:hypothetical protein
MPQFQAHQDTSLEIRLSQERSQARFVSSVEHCQRLLMERCQLNLDKRDGVNPADASTWRMSPEDLAHLTTALYNIHQINESFKGK